MSLDYKTVLKNLPEDTKIVVFDGVCNFCNTTVQYIIKKDTKSKFRYTSIQSEIGKELLKERSIDPKVIDSIILIDLKKAYYHKSTAALQIAKNLNGFISVLSALLIIPKPIRDNVYDYIAKNRYKWFGKKDECMIPTKEQRNLFL